MTIDVTHNSPCLSLHYRPGPVQGALNRCHQNLHFNPCIELQEKHYSHEAIFGISFCISATLRLAYPRRGNDRQIPIACLPTLTEVQRPAVPSTEDYQTPAR
jgi:hypothetical protein